MELKTISQVSNAYQVSTRTLRYYEQIGLITSTKLDGYAYRAYDECNILRLQQIIVLRKLRIPLKQIGILLDNESVTAAIDILQQNINSLEDEIAASSTIKNILSSLVAKLQANNHDKLKPDLLTNHSMLGAVDSLSLQRINLKEEKSMEILNTTTEKSPVLRDVRIVHLPPFTVAASHYIGEDPEENAGKQLEKFIRASNLYQIKPDARVFGFNHPNPSDDRPYYGYELWVTIPDDMEVPPPLVKKHFKGGLYAAHMITLGNFHEWNWLVNWVTVNNPKYEADYSEEGDECMGGCLEEHLNYVYYCNLDWPESDEHQLDLLLPIKLKKQE